MKRTLTTVTAAALGVGAAVIVGQTGADANVDHLSATLRDASGASVGIVRFDIDDENLTVRATLKPSSYVTPGSFHGMHVHANGDPANGSGCLVDPSAPSSTWFAAVDGHYTTPGRTHGNHDGDLPSPLVEADGTARLVFTTDRIAPAALLGRAVVLHALPDNFGNVPATQYTPLTETALDLTRRTGNAGDRVACGIIED